MDLEVVILSETCQRQISYDIAICGILTLCNPMGQPPRLCCPWNSPGKNAGVDCHFLLKKKKKNSTNELIYKTEIGTQMEKTNMVTRRESREPGTGKLGNWD